MAVQISTYTLPQMTDLVSRMFTKRLENYPYVIKNSGLVVEQNAPQGTGLFRRIAERPVKTLYARIKAEGAPASQAQWQYGYEKDIQIFRYGLDISITREMRIAGKDPEIINDLTSLADVCPQGEELDLTHRFTFGYVTSYTDRNGQTVDTTTGDGKALYDAAHTLTGSPMTYRNYLAGNPSFSKAALESIKRLVAEETLDNLGQKVAIDYNVIYCGDDENTNNQIDELMNATADVTSANAGTFNVYNKALRKVRLPLLATDKDGKPDATKRKFWGIASTDNTELYHITLEAPFLKAPRDGNNGEDFSSENWNYAARTSYGIGVISARWTKGSKGDGTA
jgi:hypothetical protein